MGKWRIEDETDFIIQENRITIGNGARKRELVSWECVWNVPNELVSADKRRQIVCVSKISRADAIAQTKAERDEFLKKVI